MVSGYKELDPLKYQPDEKGRKSQDNVGVWPGS